MEISPEQEFSRVVLSAMITRDRPIDAQTLFLGAMELEDDKHQPMMADTELRNPLQYLLLNQLAAPLFQNAIPEEDRGTLKDGISEFFADLGAPEVGTAEMQGLKSELEELRRVVHNQQAHIDQLRERLDNR